jgi:hypothetical protein
MAMAETTVMRMGTGVKPESAGTKSLSSLRRKLGLKF